MSMNLASVLGPSYTHAQMESSIDLIALSDMRLALDIRELLASFPDLAVEVDNSLPYEQSFCEHPYPSWSFQHTPDGRWIARLWPTVPNMAPFYCLWTDGAWETSADGAYVVHHDLYFLATHSKAS